MSIEVLNISKHYKNQTALKSVSFKINNPEIVGFLGPNGAGKSTMMKILTTYLKPNEGQALVNGYDILTQKIQVQQSIGYLPEHNPLYLDMYVNEFLQFNASIYKVNPQRINDVLALTGLELHAQKRIDTLSKGYRQRVGLASALLHDPKVLILDEPTTGLDPNQIIEIRQLIKSIGKTKTILLSTHIMQEVEAICDRVIIINKGEIIADKMLKDLKTENNQIIVVEFDKAIDDQYFLKLPHCNKVEHVEKFVYELSFSTPQDSRSLVFDFAQNNNLKILQLTQKQHDMVTLFKNLTTS